MFDGIDMQVSFYFTVILFLLIKFSLYYLIYFIPVIFLNCYFNLKKTIFGDSSTNIIAILISWVIIKYNFNITFNCEEIFIIMSIPGIDMLRLFCSRLLKGKNPFINIKIIYIIYLIKFKYFHSFLLINL